MATMRPSPRSKPIGGKTSTGIDMKFEVAVIPVADVDRSKEFYTKLGWRLDATFRSITGSELFSLRRLVPGPRFSLARR